MNRNTIRIQGPEDIIICNSKDTVMSGFTWTGEVLRHRSGKIMRVTAEFAARIQAAVDESYPHTDDYKLGSELYLLPAEDKQGYEYSHIHNEVHGMYVRSTPGHSVTLTYTPADVIQ